MIGGSIKNLDAVFTRIQREIGKVSDRVADRILREVKIHTPIDKGRARRGWKKRTGRNPSAGNFVQKEHRITNRVPYIGLLERGRSKQRPRGIVRPTLAAFKRGGKI
jgi:hypothetical protein